MKRLFYLLLLFLLDVRMNMRIFTGTLKLILNRKNYYSDQFDEWEHKEDINRLSFGVAIMFR